jgi:FAD/FMN-containing dehydrogenase
MNCKETVYPVSYEEVVEVIKSAERKGEKIHVMGSGKHHLRTDFYADICISLVKINKILEISESDLYVTAQSGVLVNELQKELNKRGVILPFYYDGTLGGLTSVNPPSHFTLWYPYPRDYLLGARVVTGKGELIKSGGKTPKFSSGYKIWKALSGALGSLGVYVELTFRLLPKPDRIITVDGDINTFLQERPWGIISIKKGNGELKNLIILAGFEEYIKKFEEKYKVSDLLPDVNLECERVYGIITTRGNEIEVLNMFNNGIAFYGAGYVRVCDNKALDLRKQGYIVIIEKNCKKGEECLGYSSITFKLLKDSLDPNNLFISGIE